MKVLLACDGEYRLYTEAVANAIRVFRAEAEVALVDLGKLETEAERFDPQLVIVAGSSIPPNPVDERLIAHIELSPESEQPSRFRVGGALLGVCEPHTRGDLTGSRRNRSTVQGIPGARPSY
jgi:hypothetical protein